MPLLADLLQRRDHLLSSSIEPSTRGNYARSYRHWINFSSNYHFDPIPTPHTLSLFVAWRSSVAKTIYSTLSGLAFHLRPLMVSPSWEAVRSSPLVKLAITGMLKSNAHVPKKAPPLPHTKLVTLIDKALQSSDYDTVLFAAQITVAFFCCARGAEVTMPDKEEFRDARKFSLRSETFVSDTSFRTRLPYHKADPLFMGSHLIFVREQAGTAACRLLRRYLEMRDRLHGSGGFLWLRTDGTVPRRSWYAKRIKADFGKEYVPHSPRPGGATFYILNGWPPRTVQRQGRWKSQAWEDYVRLSPEVAMAVAVAEGRVLLDPRGRRRRD